VIPRCIAATRQPPVT